MQKAHHEERRRLEGKVPRVRFLSGKERRAWEELCSKLPGEVAYELERREGGQR
jgi:hypothetical protein